MGLGEWGGAAAGLGWAAGLWEARPAAAALPCWSWKCAAAAAACRAASHLPNPPVTCFPILPPTHLHRLQMEVLLPMTVRFSNPIQCGGSWSFARYHGFFT